MSGLKVQKSYLIVPRPGTDDPSGGPLFLKNASSLLSAVNGSNDLRREVLYMKPARQCVHAVLCGG
jgi:hypothetical protein